MTREEAVPQQPVDRSVGRIATAYHEAGHAVMALLLGRPVEKVTICPQQLQTGGHRLGACRIQKGRSKASADALEDEVLILLSGMVAESYCTGRFSAAGASQDLRIARRLLANRAPQERQLERLIQRLTAKAQHRLSGDVNRRTIILVAEELIQHETISGRAVRHLFQRASATSE